MNLCYQISCRKLDWDNLHIYKHIFNNKWFLFVMGIEFGAQWLIVQFPLCNQIFRTTPLQLNMHITCWMFGVGSIIVNLAAKKIFNDAAKHSRMFDIPFNEKNDEESYNFILKFIMN